MLPNSDADSLLLLQARTMWQKGLGTGQVPIGAQDGIVMEGQQLSHAGSHTVAWGKDTHSSCAPKPPAWAVDSVT